MELTVPSLLGGSAGGLALYEVELRKRGISFLTIGQLARKRRGLEGTFTTREVSSFSGGLPSARSINDFSDDTLRGGRIFFKETRQLPANHALHETLDLRVAKFGFCLSLELRVGNTNTYHGRQALADIVSVDATLEIPRHVVTGSIGVDCPGQCGPKTGKVRASFMGINCVGKRKDGIPVSLVPLKSDIALHP